MMLVETAVASNTIRSQAFRKRPTDRYWWYHLSNTDYVPAVFGGLTDSEWDVLDAWFSETDIAYPNAGECRSGNPQPEEPIDDDCTPHHLC